MGKSIPIPIPIPIPSPQILQQFGRFATSNTNNRNKTPLQLRPVSKARPNSNPAARQMAAAQSSDRHPLSEVVSDCVKRWFQDTLKEAKAGDVSMQVLVGQMYYSGYGVVRDANKGRAWISRASRSRSSAWKVGDKRPGYNASDSDSDDTKEDAK